MDPDFLTRTTSSCPSALAHSLERTEGYYAPSSWKEGAFAEDVSKLLENFQEVRPTLMVSEPRIYERVHNESWRRVAGAPPVEKALSMGHGHRRDNLP